MAASGSFMEGLVALSPGLNLALAGMAIVIGEVFIGRKLNQGWLVSLGLLGTLLAGLFTYVLWTPSCDSAWVVFNGLATVDPLSLFVGGVVLFCVGMTLVSSVDYLRRFNLERGEYYALLLFSALGLWIMVATTNLFVVFLGLEVASIALYVLSGYFRRLDRSVEASLKYFLTGAFASTILLYGFAMTYLGAGSVDLPGIQAAIQSGEASIGTLRVAMALILIGLGFKVAVVPLHMWAPDVYEGAPSTVTGFMAAAVKAAGFGVLLRVFGQGFPDLVHEIQPVLFGLAALTILVANLIAVVQSNVKRMMAYSSVAHAGYALIGLYVLGQGPSEAASAAMKAIVFYLPAYAVATIGVFTIVSFIEDRDGRGLDIEDYAGLYRRYPGLSAAMALFVFSLAGMPPTAGFLAKFHIFGAAIEAGIESSSSQPIWLAVIGIVGSLIGLYYYLRIVVMMYMHEPCDDDRALRLPGFGVSAVVFLSAILVLWLGLGPAVGFGAADILEWAGAAVCG